MNGKTVVITGAGGVLCSCFAEALANDGMNIALIDIDFEAAKRTAEKINIKKEGSVGYAKAYKADVLNKDILIEVRNQINDDFGKCNILINGAGGNSPKCTTTNEFHNTKDVEDKDTVTFFDLDKSGFDFVFGLNMMGTLLPAQVFAADMTESPGNCIINISSMNAFKPLTKIPAYSAAKAAVTNFTQWLAVHFAPSGVRVNALAPGFFVTNQNRGLLYTETGNLTQRSEKILKSTPMGRFGKPEELLGTLRWLVDDKASGFVTGITIPVDGGFSAYSGV